MNTTEKIDRLIQFKNRDKFSDEAWGKRGLIPSDEEVCGKLRPIFANASQKIIAALQEDLPATQLHALLKAQLNDVDRYEFDTEEMEFIGDLFYEIASILEIDFGNALQEWAYGPEMAQLLRQMKEGLPPQAGQ
jgi:hypothetical protein